MLIPALAWFVALVIVIPQLGRYFKKWHASFEEELRRKMEEFHIFLSPQTIERILLSLLGAVVLVSIFLKSLIAFPVLLALCSGLVLLGVKWRLSRRLSELRYQLPAGLELIATSLRSGLSIRSSLMQVGRQTGGPIAQELMILERMQRIGVPLTEALDQWGKRHSLDEIRLFGFVVSVSTASGGNLADALDELAHSFRERLMLEEKVNALTAQGKLQAWIMVALPLILAGALTALDPASMQPLWASGRGHLVLAVIGTLEFAGLIWIRRLTRLEA